jgi:hypothetical protein
MALPVSEMDSGVREAVTSMVSRASVEGWALNPEAAVHARAAPMNSLANM